MTEPTPHAEGLWFGRGELRSFAMVHRPLTPLGHGVVICNALGFEGLLAHRPLRHLGATLAAEGRTVVRLDYPDTGDSPGDGSCPVDLAACLESIADAVTLLREFEDCTTITLVGIRAGALLAALACVADPAVAGLVLWAPCEKGSSYVRELKALARLSATSRPPGNPLPATGDPLEVVGFEYGDALLGDLAAVTLADTLPDAAVPRILLVERDDIPAPQALVDQVTAAGRTVDRERPDGYAEFMVSDETASVLPEAALAAMARWIVDEPAAGTPTPGSDRSGLDLVTPAAGRAALRLSRTLELDGVVERPVWIDERLFAIVTEPAPVPTSGPTDEGRPRDAVIMPNTGSVNRTGPGRLYTHQARRWAADGLTVVRVDLGGTGDSPTLAGLPENRPYDPIRVDELLDVVGWTKDELATDAISLFGICSGAYQSFHAALRGGDVRRVLLVNPAIFYLGPDETVGTSMGKAMIATHNMWRLRFVRSQLRRAIRSPRDLGQFCRRAGRGVAYTVGAWARPLLGRAGIHLRERDHLAGDLQQLAHADIDTVLVFAAEEPGSRYLRVFGGSALEKLLSTGAVSVVEVAGGDHVFSPPRARRAMTDAITDRLVASAATRPSTPTPVGQG